MQPSNIKIGRLNNNAVLHIAANDLYREFLLSLCLILSVIAVLTPILLLASVKVGFIDRMRQEFIEDPTFREVRPGSADLRSASTFDEIRTWPGVSYAIPTVMMNPREIAVRVTGSEGIFRSEVRLIPSTKDDPLFRRLTGAPPDSDKVVVTEDFANAAGIEIGESFTMIVTRIENDKRKRVRFDVSVNGIIPADLLPTQTILAKPEIERQVENFRSGISVPERGWEGMELNLPLSYSFIVAATPDQFGEFLKSKLKIRIGASDSKFTSLENLAGLLGIANGLKIEKSTKELLLLTPGETSYSDRDLNEANSVLRNSEAFAFGIDPPRKVSIFDQDIDLFGLPNILRLNETVGDIENARSRGDSFTLNERIVLPESLRKHYVDAGEPELINVLVEFGNDSSTESLEFLLRHSGFINEKSAMISDKLMAMINRGEQVKLLFDSNSKKFFEQSTGYRGFRVIAENIDIVPSLVERFESAGIKVRAKSSQILKLQRLERSLNILVFVVSAVALIGGYSILTSSFFANVQRKKVNYATMRLIGMSRNLIFRIPITQAMIVACIGFAASVACYQIISFLLNNFIAAELNFDGQLSKLYLSHYIFVGLFVIVGAVLASLVASKAATNIDPAEALRAQ